ncbi:hypothetical protein [Bacillus sp. B15-48]|uniref:hypothetical protein n=1 Tax=Bacillus sp. B15-48 TaxID=1548601 RepID=UPI00193F696C|nr:hypothetical protein [Bacillus sp. B15-48]MBM4765157.1 hypothetical protein [Bacillus sp. B15-48]
MKKIIGYLFFLTLQFSVLIVAVILENLATKKMGVYRYLLFYKEKYGESLLTPELVKIHSVLFIVGIIICFILFMVNMKKGEKWITTLLAIIYQIIGLFILFQTKLHAYPFFVLGIWIVIILQYLSHSDAPNFLVSRKCSTDKA